MTGHLEGRWRRDRDLTREVVKLEKRRSVEEGRGYLCGGNGAEAEGAQALRTNGVLLTLAGVPRPLKKWEPEMRNETQEEELH